jgi:hydrogenase nickel incorporation protein HypA/HybF
MHELSIALSILDLAAEESKRRGGVPISAIHVKIGVLSGVLSEALLSAYELAREGSPFADTQLVVQNEPVVIYCDHCQSDRLVESIQTFRCAYCGTPSAKVKSGRELEVTALEIRE